MALAVLALSRSRRRCSSPRAAPTRLRPSPAAPRRRPRRRPRPQRRPRPRRRARRRPGRPPARRPCSSTSCAVKSSARPSARCRRRSRSPGPRWRPSSVARTATRRPPASVPPSPRAPGCSASPSTAPCDGRPLGRVRIGRRSLSMTARVAQVVYTMTQFKTIKAVAFMLDGERVATIGGEGVIVEDPQRRADWRSFEPTIFVERPGVGATLLSPSSSRVAPPSSRPPSTSTCSTPASSRSSRPSRRPPWAPPAAARSPRRSCTRPAATGLARGVRVVGQGRPAPARGADPGVAAVVSRGPSPRSAALWLRTRR